MVFNIRKANQMIADRDAALEKERSENKELKESLDAVTAEAEALQAKVASLEKELSEVKAAKDQAEANAKTKIAEVEAGINKRVTEQAATKAVEIAASQGIPPIATKPTENAAATPTNTNKPGYQAAWSRNFFNK